MKGKDLSKPSVIRHFRRILNTALFALVLSFSVNFAFGDGICNAPIAAGKYCYSTSTSASVNPCPSGCFCPSRTSGSVSSITTTNCNSINPGYSYTGFEIGGNAYRCPKSFTLSASGSASANDCYADISAGYYYDITADSGGIISNVANTQCPAGYYCPGQTLTYEDAVNGIYGRTACPENTYNPNKRATSNSACLACATNATSSAGSAYCTCKTGYSIGGGTTGVAYSTSDSSGSTCTEISAIIALISDTQTSSGTTTIYTTYDTGVYLDSAKAIPMTSSTNAITKPTKSGYIFAGYYSSQNGGTQYINSDGYITTDGLNAAKALTSVGPHNWYPHWFAEPTCTSNQFLYDGTCIDSKFELTTTDSTDSFSFQISAAGEFYVDCGITGDFNSTGNQIGYLNRTTTTAQTTYTCSYSSVGTHVIKFGGAATGYNTDSSTAAIRFNMTSNITQDENVIKIAGISGSLGAIFGTVANPTIGQSQPRFSLTFSGASNMTGSIPSRLFTGISGTPTNYMFDRTFEDCSGLTGQIPSGLFGNLSGAPADSMFSYTFYNCSGLTGQIPSGLFGNLSGAPADSMFSYTFYNCSGLTGQIPSGLFGNLSGAPANYMFLYTFYNCSGLTGQIPSGLFGNLSGTPANYMFSMTFFNCSGLTGQIPSGLFGNLSGAPADSMFLYTFRNCRGLTGQIPSGLFGNLSGAPARYMFNSTFYGCSGLTGQIPSGLFGNLSGAPADKMFYQTFYNCGITGFTDGTNTTTYIPGTFLSGVNTDTNVPDQAKNMFFGTRIDNTCPANTYNVTREQFNDATKPWCSPCPSGTHYNGTGATSVNQCCQTGYDWDGAQCAMNCGSGEISDGAGGCECDTESDYYGSAGSCEYCDTISGDYYWDSENLTCVENELTCGEGEIDDGNGSCVCDESSDYYNGVDGCEFCDTSDGYYWDSENLTCVSAEPECPDGYSYGELSGVCLDADGCTEDEYYDHINASCQTYDEFGCRHDETWNGTECITDCMEYEYYVDDSNSEFYGTCQPKDNAYCQDTYDIDYFWDGTACSTCAGNEYLDGSQCGSKDDSWCESEYGSDYYWNESEWNTDTNSYGACSMKDDLWCGDIDVYFYNTETHQCEKVCPGSNYTRGENGCIENNTNCPAFSNYMNDQGSFGMMQNNNRIMFENGGGGYDLNNDGEITLNECFNLVGVAPSSLSDGTFSNGDVSVAYCLYNENTGNYDSSCTKRAEICNGNELLHLIFSTALNTIPTYVGYMNYNQSEIMADPLSLFAYTMNDTPLYERCSASSVCPTHSTTFASGPIAELNASGFDLNNDGEITLDECVAARVYGQIGYLFNNMTTEQIHNSDLGWLYDLMQEQNTFDTDDNRLNQIDAPGEVAFCFYNEQTGNYDGACSPAVTICNENAEGFVAAGNSTQNQVNLISQILDIDMTNLTQQQIPQMYPYTSSTIQAYDTCNRTCDGGYEWRGWLDGCFETEQHQCESDINYYWDGASCLTKDNTYCENEYGPGYYWNGAECLAKDNTYCENEIGPDYYWDSTNLQCGYCDSATSTWDGTSCQPNDTCEADYGPGWYWDDEAGQCVDEHGCAPDEEYDEEGGICHEPCSSDYYWNGNNLQCEFCDTQNGYEWNSENYQCVDTCETNYGTGWWWNGSVCVDSNGCNVDEVYDDGVCHEPCGENEYWNGSMCEQRSECPEFSQSLDGGALAELGGGYYQDYCLNARVYATDLDAFNQGNIRDAGISIAYCVYNEQTGNFDLACTQKITVCNSTEVQNIAESGTIGSVLTFMLWHELTYEQLQNLESVFAYSSTNMPTKDRCLTYTDALCPEYSMEISPGVALESHIFGIKYDFNKDGEITLDECVTTRIYGQVWLGIAYMQILANDPEFTPLKLLTKAAIRRVLNTFTSGYDNDLENMSYLTNLTKKHQNKIMNMLPFIFLGQDSYNSVNANHVAGFALCRYDTQTKSYDTNCTPILPACNISELQMLDDAYETTDVIPVLLSTQPDIFSLSGDNLSFVNRCNCSNTINPDYFCTSCPTGFELQNRFSSPNWNCQPITYNIYFDGNGADGGSMEQAEYKYGTEYILPENQFTRSGYRFVGWVNSPYDADISYTQGEKVSNLATSSNETVYLYAKWEETITSCNSGEYIDNNTCETCPVFAPLSDGSGDINMCHQDLNGGYYYDGTDQTIKTCTANHYCPVVSLYYTVLSTSNASQTTLNLYDCPPHSHSTISSPYCECDATWVTQEGSLYATLENICEQHTMELTFYEDDNQQEAFAETSCAIDNNIVLPDAPTRPGYTFAGWKLKDGPQQDTIE